MLMVSVSRKTNVLVFTMITSTLLARSDLPSVRNGMFLFVVKMFLKCFCVHKLQNVLV